MLSNQGSNQNHILSTIVEASAGLYRMVYAICRVAIRAVAQHVAFADARYAI